MQLLCVFTLYVLGANAAALSPRGIPTGYPNRAYSYDGRKCTSYSMTEISEVPHECVYEIVCNIYSADAFKRCFKEGSEPKGKMEIADLSKLPFYCRQQAICGFPEEQPLPIPKSEDPTKKPNVNEIMDNSVDFMSGKLNEDSENVDVKSLRANSYNLEGDLGKFPPKYVTQNLPPLNEIDPEYYEQDLLYDDSNDDDSYDDDSYEYTDYEEDSFYDDPNQPEVVTSDPFYYNLEGDLGKFPPKKIVEPLFLDSSEI